MEILILLVPADFLVLQSIEAKNEYQNIDLGAASLESLRRSGASSKEILEAKLPLPYLTSTSFQATFKVKPEYKDAVAELQYERFKFPLTDPKSGTTRTFEFVGIDLQLVLQRTKLNAKNELEREPEHFLFTAITCGGPID